MEVNSIDAVSVETDGVVWQNDYEEVVTYEESIDLNNSFNISPNQSDDYETAIEDDSQKDESQYYSVIDNTIQNETLTPDNHGNFVNVTQESVEDDIIDETLIVKNAPETCKINEQDAHNNDEVVLYRVEGSDELFAVQYLLDETGNLQKYQYQVRETEDGQYEAIPGTIELQPPEISEKSELRKSCDDMYKSVDHDNYEIQENIPEHYISTLLPEPNLPGNLETETNNCIYENSNNYAEVNQIDIEPVGINEVNITKQSIDNLYDGSMYEEYLEDSDDNPSRSFQEYREYFETDGSVEISVDNEKSPKVKSDVQILSQIIQKPVKKSLPKQVVIKAEQNKLKANIISIVQDNGILKKKIATPTNICKVNSIFDNSDFDIRPIEMPRSVSDSRNNKKMTFLIVSRNNDPRLAKEKKTEFPKNSRSILKSNVILPKNDLKNDPKVLNLIPAQIIMDVDTKNCTEATMKEPEKQVSRQPRKQTIKPVDRVGSEIIIQPSEEEARVMMYDLEISDGEYTPSKIKSPKRKKVPKKRGRKPKMLEIIISDSEDNIVQPEMQIESKTETSETNEAVIPIPVENADPVTVNSDTPTEKTDINNVMDNVLSIMEEIHGDQTNDKSNIEIKETENYETDTLLSLLESNSPDEKRPKTEAVNSDENKPVTSPKSKLWKCSKCPKSFPKEIALKTHLHVHNIREKRNFTCGICSKQFIFQRSYENHIKIHRENTKNADESRIPKIDTTLMCDICSKTFTNISSLNTHKSFHRQRYKCDKCPRIFSDKSRQLLHSKVHTKNITITPVKNTQVRPKVSSTRTLRLSNKMPNESPRKLFTCDVCSKPFRQLSLMMIHRDQHKISCSNCGKKFHFKHLLDEHIRRYCINSSLKKKKSSLLKTKSVDKNCDACKKTFRTSFAYFNHLKFIHKGEKSTTDNNDTTSSVPVKKFYNLNNKLLKSISDKKEKENFYSKPANNKDVVKSTDESTTERRQSIRKQVPSQKVTALKCNLCELSFSTHTGLFRHSRTHAETVHKCKSCDRIFPTSDLLTAHGREHLNNKKFNCKTCSRNFLSEELLFLHVKKSNHKFASPRKVKLIKRRLAHTGIPLSAKMQSAFASRTQKP